MPPAAVVKFSHVEKGSETRWMIFSTSVNMWPLARRLGRPLSRTCEFFRENGATGPGAKVESNGLSSFGLDRSQKPESYRRIPYATACPLPGWETKVRSCGSFRAVQSAAGYWRIGASVWFNVT